MPKVSISSGLTRAIYSDEFKMDVANYAQDTGDSYGDIAKKFGVSYCSVQLWCKARNGSRRHNNKGEIAQPTITNIDSNNPLATIGALIDKQITFKIEYRNNNPVVVIEL